MRKLNTEDVIKAMRFIKKTGIRQVVLELVEKAKNSAEPLEHIGLNAFFAVMDAALEAEHEQALYELVAGPFEMTAEDVKCLELDELIEMSKRLAKENNFEHFFTSLSGMITTGQ